MCDPLFIEWHFHISTETFTVTQSVKSTDLNTKSNVQKVLYFTINTLNCERSACPFSSPLLKTRFIRSLDFKQNNWIFKFLISLNFFLLCLIFVEKVNNQSWSTLARVTRMSWFINRLITSYESRFRTGENSSARQMGTRLCQPKISSIKCRQFVIFLF